MGTQVSTRKVLTKMYLSKWSGVRRNWMRENIFLLSCMHSFHRFNTGKLKIILSTSVHASAWASSSFPRVLLLLPALICTSWESSAWKYEWEPYGGSSTSMKNLHDQSTILGRKAKNTRLSSILYSIDPICSGDASRWEKENQKLQCDNKFLC